MDKKYVFDSEEVKKILPHRYPFLLVDRITQMTDISIEGIKNISASEPFFQGHFPGKPVMPGVLIIEALAQVGGLMMLAKGENQGKLAYLVGVDGARFRRMVIPGDQLVLKAETLKFKSRLGIVKAEASVDGEVACTAELMFALGD